MSAAKKLEIVSVPDDPRSRVNSGNLIEKKKPKGGMFFEKIGALLKLEEAAQLLRVEVPTLRDWRYHRKLPEEVFVLINGRLRIRLDSLERWILSQNP